MTELQSAYGDTEILVEYALADVLYVACQIQNEMHVTPHWVLSVVRV